MSTIEQALDKLEYSNGTVFDSIMPAMFLFGDGKDSLRKDENLFWKIVVSYNQSTLICGGFIMEDNG